MSEIRIQALSRPQGLRRSFRLRLPDDIAFSFQCNGVSSRVVHGNPDALALLTFAIAVYFADRIISRRHFAFDGWNRPLSLHVPTAADLFTRLRLDEASQMLNFLTGDTWSVTSDGTAIDLPIFHHRRDLPDLRGHTVCLFSGGLDSLVGAINLLHSGKNVVLVGRCGYASETGPQQKIVRILRQRFGPQVNYLSFNVVPRKPITLGIPLESTFRSRSLLFIAMAAFIASSVGADRTIHFPENGFIALNPPLGPERAGALSTRTAHPYFAGLVANMLGDIDNLELYNPFRFMTKGDVLQACDDKGLLRRLMPLSVSCGKSGRFRTLSTRMAGRVDPAAGNCGLCWPCLIRRAAQFAFDPNYRVPHEYFVPSPPRCAELNRRSRFVHDYTVVERLLQKLEGARSRVCAARTVATGQITRDGHFREYLDLCERGFRELKHWQNALK